MLCRQPFVKDGMAFGCGQCMPCRVNRRRIWAHRIMLEAAQYKDNAFVTLTYSDNNLPDVDKYPGGNLVPKDFQDWLKRFRKSCEPLRVRFYGVGEYGDTSERAHFHVALFGFPQCSYGSTRIRSRDNDGSSALRCCASCASVYQSWNRGLIHCGSLTTESAQYIAGYVTKKLTAWDDPRLAGRHPEFSRMSLRPGIGADFMHEVASGLMQFNLDESQADVPSSLRHGGRVLPLGRYLRRRLRRYVGMEESAPESTLKEMAEAMRPVREDAFNTSKSFKQAIIEAGDQKVAQMEAKSRIFKKVRPI